MKNEDRAATGRQTAPKRYRLEVYEPRTRDGRDRTLYYKTWLMAKINAIMAREIGATRIVLVDTLRTSD